MFSIDIEKVGHLKALRVVKLLTGIIIAPFWFIFQFQYELFQKTDFLKLILISFAIGAPLVVFTTDLFLRNAAKMKGSTYIKKIDQIVRDEETAKLYFNALQGGVIVSIFTFYTPCMFSYFVKLNFWQAIKWSIGAYSTIYLGVMLFMAVKTGYFKKSIRQQLRDMFHFGSFDDSPKTQA